jgi:ABC-type uncharacterized transport system permease subunit
MTGSLKARQPHRRDFSVSASIPVLSIARGSELWGFLNLGFLGVTGFSAFYCHIVRSATSSWCLVWGLSGFISLFMSFFRFYCRNKTHLSCVYSVCLLFLCRLFNWKLPYLAPEIRTEHLLLNQSRTTYRATTWVGFAQACHTFLP